MSRSLGGLSGVSFGIVLRSSVAVLSNEILRPPVLHATPGGDRPDPQRINATRRTSDDVDVAFRSSMRLCVNVRALFSRVAAQAPRLADNIRNIGCAFRRAEEL